jgi:ATP-binding protein involved in chromosome partitioning
MSKDYNSVVGAVLNPATSKTLAEEKKIASVNVKDNEIYIKYKRDGLTPEHKKIVEESMIKALGQDFSTEKIVITSVVESAANAPQSKEAELKVGHGTVGNKKPIPNVKKVIAVASGKGGVGKSTFTANLALSLKNMGFKVGIIDADIYGPSIPMLLGQREAKPKVNENKKILPVDAYGIGFISFGLFIAENDPVIWRGPMLGGVLNQFLFDVDWTGYDYVILDLPPGTGDIQLSMVQNTVVDGAIVISTPQDVALLDAKKGLQMFRKVNVPVIGMVENMSMFICDSCGKEHHIFGHNGVSNSVKELETEFIGAIPLEIELRLGSDSGNPYMANEKFKDRPVYKAYTEISKKVHDHFYGEKKTSLFSKIFK